jgi:hypothetical protein
MSQPSADKPDAQDGITPLAPEWLLEPLPKPEGGIVELEVTDSRFETISALILRGEYITAGHHSETLLKEGVYDVRVLGYYLFGVFIERGLMSLPLVFRALMRFLGEEYALFGPTNKKQLQTENMLLWLVAGIVKNAELHSTMKDGTWKEWLEPKNRPPIDEATQLCPQMQAALSSFAPGSRASQRFQSLDNWLEGFGHSETGVTRRASETSSESKSSQASRSSSEASKPNRDEDKDEDEDESQDDDERRGRKDEEEDGEEDEDHRPRALRDDDDDENEDKPHSQPGKLRKRRQDDDMLPLEQGGSDDEDEDRTGRHERPLFGRRGVSSRDDDDRDSYPEAPGPSEGSKEWKRLLERLQAFGELVEQGQYLKAAVVATDIQAAVSSFDPVAYFPGLFAPYLSAFAEHMRPLEHYLNDTQAVKFKILRQLYQVDFEKFMRRD